MIEFVQQLFNVTEGLLRKADFEPALIAGFGITLILTARIINRITSFRTCVKRRMCLDWIEPGSPGEARRRPARILGDVGSLPRRLHLLE